MYCITIKKYFLVGSISIWEMFSYDNFLLKNLFIKQFERLLKEKPGKTIKIFEGWGAYG